MTVLSELLERADFDSLLYLSSTRVYAKSMATSESEVLRVLPEDPSDLYNISKLMGESLCLSSEREGVRIARLSNVVGPKMGADNLIGALMHEALSGVIQLKTNPDSAKDYILINDVARALWLIAGAGCQKIYNVASGTQITHSQWLHVLQLATGCSIKTEANAPLQSFHAIDVARLKNEFDFISRSVLDAVPSFFEN